MATKHTSESPVTALDVIFSCFICQKTLSEAYSDPESTKGFNDGRDSGHDAIVTKLWLTECAHLICGEHFEGGGKQLLRFSRGATDLPGHRRTIPS